jgi:hypothetical protein
MNGILFTASMLNGFCPRWLVTDYKPLTAVLAWSGNLLLAFASQSF